MAREIERQIVSAIKNKEIMGAGNTVIAQDGTRTRIYLHGHHIATIDYVTKKVWLSSAGYPSNVTKSRLNCVLDALGIDKGVVTRNRVLCFQNGWKENKEILEPFKDGVELSFK